MKNLSRIVRLMAAVTLAVMISATAFAADVTIRVAHLNPEGAFESHSGAMTTIFKSLVESSSGGAIEVNCFRTGNSAKTTRSSSRFVTVSSSRRSLRLAVSPSIILWSACSIFPSRFRILPLPIGSSINAVNSERNSPLISRQRQV